MLRSYLTTALRGIRRYKGYAFINIFGLAVGLAACLLIGLYVRFELSFDRMHENADRIVRIEMDVERSGTGSPRWKTLPILVAPDLKERVPGLEEVTRVSGGGPVAVSVGENRFYESGFYQGEPSFFDVFDFSVLSGSPSGLERPGTVMISKSMADRYFEGTNPVGKTLSVAEAYSSATRDFEVVGTFEDMPANVHFRADFLSSMATRLAEYEDRPGSWQSAYTYALLSENASMDGIEAGFNAYETDVMKEKYFGGYDLALRPLTEIHLYGGPERDIQPQGDIRYVWIFSAIAALILVIACINYMNLATARSASRSREVGVRKVVGARRGQLIHQFLSESILFAGAALLLAIALAQAALPVFNTMMDQSLSFAVGDLDMMLYLVLAALAVGFLSGSYPALVLSRMKPAGVLKGSAGGRSGTWLRKGLVVFQFVVSMALMVGTIVIQRQLGYVREAKLGFDKEQVLTLSTQGRLGQQTNAFRSELEQIPSVAQVSMASSVPGQGGWKTGYGADQIEEYDGEPVDFDLMWTDGRFFDTMGLELAAGRAFDPAFASDAETAVLLNETAAKALGWDNPIGKTFNRSDERLQVVGVIKDFHNASLKEAIGPMMLRQSSEYVDAAILRLGTGDLPSTLARISDVWDRFIPDLPFQYSFLDDAYDAMYRSEQRLADLFSAFSTLAVIIAALGLFGLAAFTAQQRTKEIGIRKVLGASVSGLVLMLSKDFVRLVVVAFVLAAPIAWFVMDNWLSAFAYRIDIGPGIFLFSGLMALAIALGSVTWQAVRAATSDPVQSLRYE